MGLGQGAAGVPCLVVGSSLLCFFGSVDVSALCIKNSGPVPSSGKGPAFPILLPFLLLNLGLSYLDLVSRS